MTAETRQSDACQNHVDVHGYALMVVVVVVVDLEEEEVVVVLLV